MKSFSKTFSELSRDELYAILRVRAEVFVVGQRCFYLDPDGIDQRAVHVGLVDAGGADEPTHRGDALVIFPCQHRAGIGLRVDHHAPELGELEALPSLGQPDLAVEHRAAVLEFDGQRRDQHQGA